MRTFKTRRRVSHTARKMFDLVADIERYPAFVPMCEGLTVRSRQSAGSRTTIIADMTIGYKAFRETFTSRVVLDTERLEIVVDYLDGPFRSLENRWAFQEVSATRSDVDFYIAYEFRSLPLQLLVGGLFDKAFRRLAEAFERRADNLFPVAMPSAV